VINDPFSILSSSYSRHFRPIFSVAAMRVTFYFLFFSELFSYSNVSSRDNHGITEFGRYLWRLPSFGSQFCIICQFLRMFSSLSIQVINDEVKQYWSLYPTLLRFNLATPEAYHN